jgi:hypothetical protein
MRWSRPRRPGISRRPRVRRTIDAVSGTVLVALGIALPPRVR